MSTESPLIEAHSLSLNYGPHRIIENLDCTVRPGELLGITGANGAGKTTLLKAFAGIHKPAAGELRRHPSATRPGYVPQHSPVLRTFPLTAAEFLAINHGSRMPWLGGIPRKLRQGICGKLDCLGIAHLAKRTIGTLSGGELQRVRIAAALLDEPTLLLLDEPSSHLDAASSASLKTLLQHLHTEHHLTLVIVSHDESFLRDLATRRGVLDHRATALA
jgi:ABC-type Mn2+/Zn2+ transport system ATPase subunit